jgi:Derlin-2/3
MDLTHFVQSFPVVTRTYMAGALLTTAACALDVLSPFSLYLSWSMVIEKGQVRWAAVCCYKTNQEVRRAGCCMLTLISLSLSSFYGPCVLLAQVWRLFTNFFFFGAKFSLEFLFHMFFLVQYCRNLEEGSFRGRTADFFYMMVDSKKRRAVARCSCLLRCS